MTTASATPFEIQEKIATLQEALLASDPEIPTLLRDIHRNLKKDPEIVTLLSEEECSAIVKGLKHQTKKEITVAAVKKSKTKAASKITLSDL